MALGILSVLTISTVVVVDYSSSNARVASASKDDKVALALAEAGLNNAIAILNNPSNNALQQSTLPSSEGAATVASYQGGTARWWGVLVGNTWTVYGQGRVRNPTGGTELKRTVSANVAVQSSLTQPLNNQAWNYMMSTRTGNECDMTLGNSIIVRDPIYTMGNLCLDNSAQIQKGPLTVNGYLWLKNSSSVGSSGAPINELHVDDGCKNGGGSPSPLRNPCANGAPSAGDNVWATTITSSPPSLTAPVADWSGWYADGNTLNSTAECNVISGTPPTFDEDSIRDNGVTSVQNLTPSSSYTCRKTSGGNTVAELSWNSSTKVLTVAGTIFIDGSATVTNSATQYNGQASLYLSGVFTLGNSARLCGGLQSSDCNFASWNPNTEMLAIVTNGSGGGAGTGNGVNIGNSSQFQGALYATYDIELGNSTKVEGPMVAAQIKLVNSVETQTFGTITSVPVAMPGNPNVYAQPQPPGNYSG